MTDVKCRWCPRDVSKHTEIALRICLLRAIRDKGVTSPAISHLDNIENDLVKKEAETQTMTEKPKDDN